MLKITTSTDSLSPESRFFDAMMQAETAPRVRYHNIIGIYEARGASALFGGTKEPSDGVVSVESAQCPDAVSQIQIPSEHSSVHQHPRAILEVRRILTEHLYEVFGIAGTNGNEPDRQVVPATLVKPENNPASYR